MKQNIIPTFMILLFISMVSIVSHADTIQIMNNHIRIDTHNLKMLND